MINTLEKARNFEDAEKIVSILNEYDTFSLEQVNKIIKYAIQNNQVRMCEGGRIFLESLMSKYRLMILPKLRLEFEYIKDSF